MKFHEIKAPDILKERTAARMRGVRRPSKKSDIRWLSFAICAVSVLLLSSLLTYQRLSLRRASEKEQRFYRESESLTEQGRQTADILKLEQPEADAASENIPYSEKPREDNTSPEAVDYIRNAFILQSPLQDYTVSCAYNDYAENGVALHPEADLAAEAGSEIRPITGGTVTETGFDASLGNYVIIDHGSGLVSTYGHCKEVYVSEGTSVSLDTVIGTVGQSGMATGPFLSLSVTLDGASVNPQALWK